MLRTRVSEPVTMGSPSRHACQGGAQLVNPVEPEEASSINPYEELRNRRKKELHDEVERALLESGFTEAARLRLLFSGEVREEEGSAEKTLPQSRQRRRSPWGGLAGELRRSSRLVVMRKTTTETPEVHYRNKTKVRQDFRLA
jgi:hypothetical protein